MRAGASGAAASSWSGAASGRSTSGPITRTDDGALPLIHSPNRPFLDDGGRRAHIGHDVGHFAPGVGRIGRYHHQPGPRVRPHGPRRTGPTTRSTRGPGHRGPVRRRATGRPPAGWQRRIPRPSTTGPLLPPSTDGPAGSARHRCPHALTSVPAATSRAGSGSAPSGRWSRQGCRASSGARSLSVRGGVTAGGRRERASMSAHNPS